MEVLQNLAMTVGVFIMYYGLFFLFILAICSWALKGSTKEDTDVIIKNDN